MVFLLDIMTLALGLNDHVFSCYFIALQQKRQFVQARRRGVRWVRMHPQISKM